MELDRMYVRKCQSNSCLAPFADGERACRHCGRHRTQRCWTIGIYGAFRADALQIADALDAEFNADVFIGRIWGQLLRLEQRVWRLEDPVVQIGLGAPEDGTAAIVHALERAGFLVELPAQRPVIDVSETRTPIPLH